MAKKKPAAKKAPAKAPAEAPAKESPGFDLVSPGTLIERTIFKKDTTLLSNIEHEFQDSLRENRNNMIILICILISVMLAILLSLGVIQAQEYNLQLIGTVLAILLSLGLGIQVGTMFHASISKKVTEEMVGTPCRKLHWMAGPEGTPGSRWTAIILGRLKQVERYSIPWPVTGRGTMENPNAP